MRDIVYSGADTQVADRLVIGGRRLASQCRLAELKLAEAAAGTDGHMRTRGGLPPSVTFMGRSSSFTRGREDQRPC